MEPALFSPAALFGPEEDDENSAAESENALEFVERSHEISGMVLSIREFTFHQVNANLLWPGTLSFAEWLVAHGGVIKGKKILELGSGTGALSIFLRKRFDVDITTSDYDDEVIEENIAYNCSANGLSKLPHIRHTWGHPLPENLPSWDLILASDILLYVKQYPNLIKTLLALLKSSKTPCITKTDKDLDASDSCLQLPHPCFLMSWRRRLPKEDEAAFFDGCEGNGLHVNHLGSRIYCISRIK